MTKDAIHPLLKVPLKTLGLSAEFMAMANANGYKTLEDILHEPLHEIPLKNNSGYRVLKELLTVLEENGLAEMIDEG